METIKDKNRIRQALSTSSYTELFPRAMDHYAILQRSSPGEMLIRQGSEPENLFYLLRGRCSVNCVLPNGKNIILSSISHPCLIGEMELIDPKRSALSVKTLEYCELLTFPMSVSRSVLLNNVSFLQKICILLADKEFQSVKRFFAASGCSLNKRLAAFILEQREGDEYRIRKKQAAETLGVSYRHLETVLNSFLNEGILSKNHLVYHIEKEYVLCELAKEIQL